MPPFTFSLCVAFFGGLCAWGSAAGLLMVILEHCQRNIFQSQLLVMSLIMLVLFVISLFFGDYQALYQIIKTFLRFPIYA